MKKLFVFIIMFCIFLVLTNPSKSEYTSWQSNVLKENSDRIIADKLIEWVGKDVIENRTSEVDYKLFTLFETNFSELGIEPIKAIGIVKVFIPLPSKINIYSLEKVLTGLIAFVVLILALFIALRIIKLLFKLFNNKKDEDIDTL